MDVVSKGIQSPCHSGLVCTKEESKEPARESLVDLEQHHHCKAVFRHPMRLPEKKYPKYPIKNFCSPISYRFAFSHNIVAG